MLGVLDWATILLGVVYNCLATICLIGTTVAEVNLPHPFFSEYKSD